MVCRNAGPSSGSVGEGLQAAKQRDMGAGESKVPIIAPWEVHDGEKPYPDATVSRIKAIADSASSFLQPPSGASAADLADFSLEDCMARVEVMPALRWLPILARLLGIAALHIAVTCETRCLLGGGARCIVCPLPPTSINIASNHLSAQHCLAFCLKQLCLRVPCCTSPRSLSGCPSWFQSGCPKITSGGIISFT